MNQIINNITSNTDSMHLMLAVIVIISTWYIHKMVCKAIIKISHDHKIEPKLLRVILHIARLTIYSIGICLILENLHFQVSTILGTLGAVAIGIGLALQKVLADMTCGILILFYKPYFEGDYIISEKHKFEGEIIDINLRLTTLKFNDDIIFVPNLTLYSSVITLKNGSKTKLSTDKIAQQHNHGK